MNHWKNSRLKLKVSWAIAALALVATISLAPKMYSAGSPQNRDRGNGIRHVLLISIDGMHAADYLNCSKGLSGVNGGKPFCPQLAQLGQTGVNYTRTTTSRPSDSFPGLMALVS